MKFGTCEQKWDFFLPYIFVHPQKVLNAIYSPDLLKVSSFMQYLRVKSEIWDLIERWELVYSCGEIELLPPCTEEHPL